MADSLKSSTGSADSNSDMNSHQHHDGDGEPSTSSEETLFHDTNGASHLVANVNENLNQQNNNVPNNNTTNNRDRNSFKSSRTKPVIAATKTNLVIIPSAISKALEGPANFKLLKKVQDTIDAHAKTCDHFLILFKDRQQFRGLYRFDEKLQTITKLEGVGPKTIQSEDIARYFKFDYSKRQFMELQTKNIGPTTIAISIQEKFWFRHRQRVGNN